MAQTIEMRLIRHGKAESDGMFDGGDFPGAGLSEIGRYQALLTSAKIWENTGYFTDIVILSSDQQRSVETVKKIAGNYKISFSSGLRERRDGEWAGLRKDDIEREFPDNFEGWRAGRYLPDGCESFKHQENRVWNVIDGTLSRGYVDNSKILVLVVTSGNPIRAVVGRILNTPIERRHRMRIDNCGITAVRFDGNAWELLFLNNTSHL
ncbi:MAG: Fructose-2,6-bisphosphatase [Parcubacteria group bacterium Gr01-1014_33]|nr:MAG: Fructose-2,6-bisphosphatase [Parcubacteria group bacterium Gr01-1014_33]